MLDLANAFACQADCFANLFERLGYDRLRSGCVAGIQGCTDLRVCFFRLADNFLYAAESLASEEIRPYAFFVRVELGFGQRSV